MGTLNSVYIEGRWGHNVVFIWRVDKNTMCK